MNGALNGNSPIGRGDSATQGRGGNARNTFGQRYDISGRVTHCHILGEGTPAVETGLILEVADVLVAAATLNACAAAGDERYGYALTHELARDVTTHFHHHAGEFVTRYVGEVLDVRVVSAPAVPIAAAEARRFDLDDSTVGRRRWIGKRLD